MTGDDRLRKVLEELERSVPADVATPSTAPAAPRRLVLALTAIAGVVFAGALIGLSMPGLIGTESASASPEVSDVVSHSPREASTPDARPSHSAGPATVTFISSWAVECCGEGEFLYAVFEDGETRVEHTFGPRYRDAESVDLAAGRYDLTLFYRSCTASCEVQVDPPAGHCHTPVDLESAAELLIRVTWHPEEACETVLAARPSPSRHPIEVTGVIRLGRVGDDHCMYVLDALGYTWDVTWPTGYRVDLTPAWGVVLLDGDGEIVARSGEQVTIAGASTTAEPTGCIAGIAYRASEIIDVRPGGERPAEPLLQVPTAAPIRPGAVALCLDAEAQGSLARDPDSGFVLVYGDGRRVVPIWPHGFVAREGASGLELLDVAGHVVAREGNLVRLHGGGNDSTFSTCEAPLPPR